jgi:hypothetical protein
MFRRKGSQQLNFEGKIAQSVNGMVRCLLEFTVLLWRSESVVIATVVTENKSCD